MAVVGFRRHFALAWWPLCAVGDAVRRVDAACTRSMIWRVVCLAHDAGTTLSVTDVRLLYGSQRGCVRVVWDLGHCHTRVVVGVKIIDF